MKRRWNVISAIRAVGGELNEEGNILTVKFPLKGLEACSALDFLKNHTSLNVICFVK